MKPYKPYILISLLIGTLWALGQAAWRDVTVAPGGGGDTLWANLPTGTASLNNSSATNVVIDGGMPLPDNGNYGILNVLNDGTNIFYIQPNGGIFSGRGVPTWSPDNNDGIIMARVVSLGDAPSSGSHFVIYGDPSQSYLADVSWFETADPNIPLAAISVTAAPTNSSDSLSWTMTASPGNSTLELVRNSQYLLKYFPDATPDQVPYLWNTLNVITNTMFEFKNASTNIYTIGPDGMATAFGGLSSKAANNPIAISSTGWTNSLGKQAVVTLTATSATWIKYNNAGAAIATNATTFTGNSEIILQPSGAFHVTAGSVIGVANPF